MNILEIMPLNASGGKKPRNSVISQVFKKAIFSLNFQFFFTI